jgi:hypothetical protein
MKLFDRFDKVYCINLKKRTDRLENFTQEVNKYDLGKFEVFEAIDGSTVGLHPTLLKGEMGIIHSVIKILEISIQNKYEKILILEDDCVFNDNVKEIDNYFSYLPENWDMIYFGGNHNTHVGIPPPVIINKRIVKLHCTFSAHCIGIKKNMFEILLPELNKFLYQLDVVYQKLQTKHNIYCFNPLVASQKPGFSDIQNKVVNYDYLIK